MNLTRENKLNQICQYWKEDPEFMGYALLQLGLHLCGVQSLNKSADILNWSYQDTRVVLYSVKRCLDVKDS